MGATTEGMTSIQEMSAQLAESLRANGSARATFGSEDAAFAWAGGNMPRGCWTFCATGQAKGGSFTTVIVEPTATPPAVVAPGGVKPTAVTLTTEVRNLLKFAGQAVVQAESVWYADVLANAIVATIINGSLMALEGHCLTVLGADAGLTQGGATWPAAVLGAIGQVAGAGGRPDLLVISAADFATAVEAPSQLQFAGTDAIPTYLGLQLHLSPKAVAGTAYVLDSTALAVAESTESPSVMASLAPSTNTVALAADVMAVAVATAPGLIAEVVPTIAPLDARKK